MFEFSQHQKGELEIVNANSINHNYLKKITPIVLITNYLSDVFQWKSPAHTLIFGLVLTLCALYLQIIIAFGFFLFYINTPFFLRQLLKIPYGKQKIKKELNIFERNKNKLIKLKRNMTHIQEAQKDYIKKYDYLKALITNEDRTDLIQITLNSRKYILFVILFIIFFDTLTCFLICFWVLLLKNSVYGKPILTELQNGLETFNRIINENIDYIARKFRIFPVPPAIHSVVKKHSDNLSSQKTFIIYENQRWWIGKGWSDLLLPGGINYFDSIFFCFL